MGGRKGKYSSWSADIEAVKTGRMLRQDFIVKVLGKLDKFGETYFDKMADLVARAIGNKESTIAERERARLCIDFFKNFTPKMVDMYVETPPEQEQGFKVVLGAEMAEEAEVVDEEASK